AVQGLARSALRRRSNEWRSLQTAALANVPDLIRPIASRPILHARSATLRPFSRIGRYGLRSAIDNRLTDAKAGSGNARCLTLPTFSAGLLEKRALLGARGREQYRVVFIDFQRSGEFHAHPVLVRPPRHRLDDVIVREINVEAS